MRDCFSVGSFDSLVQLGQLGCCLNCPLELLEIVEAERHVEQWPSFDLLADSPFFLKWDGPPPSQFLPLLRDLHPFSHVVNVLHTLEKFSSWVWDLMRHLKLFLCCLSKNLNIWELGNHSCILLCVFKTIIYGTHLMNASFLNLCIWSFCLTVCMLAATQSFGSVLSDQNHFDSDFVCSKCNMPVFSQKCVFGPTLAYWT